MKKIIAYILVVSLTCSFTTFNTFAEKRDSTTETVEELKRISESINLNMRTLISGDYNKESLIKNLKFITTQLNSIVKNVQISGQEDSENLLKKREYSTILAIISLYLLAINGMMIFLEDQNDYEFLLDSAAEIQTADMFLEKISSSIKN